MSHCAVLYTGRTTWTKRALHFGGYETINKCLLSRFSRMLEQAAQLDLSWGPQRPHRQSVVGRSVCQSAQKWINKASAGAKYALRHPCSQNWMLRCSKVDAARSALVAPQLGPVRQPRRGGGKPHRLSAGWAEQVIWIGLRDVHVRVIAPNRSISRDLIRFVRSRRELTLAQAAWGVYCKDY